MQILYYLLERSHVFDSALQNNHSSLSLDIVIPYAFLL